MYELLSLLFFVFSTTDSGAGKCEASSEILHFFSVSWRRPRAPPMVSSALSRSSRLVPVFPVAFSRAIWVFLRLFLVFSGFGSGSCFSLRPSGLPFPPSACFPVRPVFGRVFFFFLFFALLF